MALFPLDDLLGGIKSIGVRLLGKKSDGNLGNVSVTDEGAVLTQLTGSKMEHFGAVIGDRPGVNTVPKGAEFTIVDDAGEFPTWKSNGTKWVEV